MKKLLLILLLFSGCSITVTETQEERNARIKAKELEVQSLFEQNVSKVEYEKHSYLFFYHDIHKTVAIEHDPNCNCQR